MIFPKTIWNMINLNHIHIKSGVIARFPSEFIECCNKLDGLTSFSSLFIRDGFELVRMMKKVPNLKKLKFKLLYYSMSKNFNLDFLHQLEELSIFSQFGQFIYPACLKKLTFTDRSVGDGRSVIGELPNLEVLKLVNVRAVKFGTEWCMKDGEFKKLRFLTLENINIDILDASMEHFPRLEQLVLEFCRYLDELPSLGESPFLKLIAARYCNTSTVASAQSIQEDQLDMGNHQFKLEISGDHWNQSEVKKNQRYRGHM